jgi:L-ascorbate metabolism protein UlaG (beta-lactamase superfamily)
MSSPRPYHHTASGFRNPPGSPRRMFDSRVYWRFIWQQIRQSRQKTVVPDGHVLPEDEALAGLAAQGATDSLTWLGHAAFLVRLAGRTLLLDPYLGRWAGPGPGLGPQRYAPPGIAPERLPRLDGLLISHNHYDHLCDETLRRLTRHGSLQTVVPLKLGDHLRRRGYHPVHELDWHDRVAIGDVTVTALPAVHWSKRTAFDANKTLWASYLIEGNGLRLWFAGDTAHGAVFRQLGQALGPIDYALVPIGAYEPRAIMQAAHTTPEEAVTIGRELNARRLVAMHWGTVVLTTEPQFEPPGRFRAAAEAAGYAPDDAWVMRVGETRPLRPWPTN